MFPVHIVAHVHSHDSELYLSRDIELPFVPTPGMYLKGITRGADTEGEQIYTVRWDTSLARFTVDLAEQEDSCSLSEWVDWFGPEWRLLA